jgi:hypothetical protein
MKPEDDNTIWRPGEASRWHQLGGLPDNVTEDGEIVSSFAGQRAQITKDQLRVEITRLRTVGEPAEVAILARLASGYLLAGDAETAGRYVSKALDLLSADKP